MKTHTKEKLYNFTYSVICSCTLVTKKRTNNKEGDVIIHTGSDKLRQNDQTFRDE